MATYTEGSIVYEVSIDTKNMMQNSTKVREELNRLNANGKSASKGLDQVEQSADRASQSMFKLSSVAKAVSAALVSSQVISYAQSWNELEDRIANTGATAYQTKEILDQLLETSNRNGRSIEESSELYIRLSNSMKEMGYSTNDTLSYLGSMSDLFTINQTNAMGAESAINSLTKAQLKGKLSGDEALVVFKNMPSVLSTLANYLKKTAKSTKEAEQYTEQYVQKLARDGNLSMRLFTDALIGSNAELDAFADNMRNKTSDGITRITNNLKKYFGELNNATGGTRLIVDALILMSQHVNILATGVGVLGAIYAGKYVTSLAAATKSSYDKIVADIKQAAAVKELAAAEVAETAQKIKNLQVQKQNIILGQSASNSLRSQISLNKQLAVVEAELTAATNAHAAAQAKLALNSKFTAVAMNGLKSAMNLLGGPAGILLIAAGAMYSWIASNEAAKESALQASQKVEDLAQSFDKLTQKQKEAAKASLDVSIDKQKESIKNLTLEVGKAKYELQSYQATYKKGTSLSKLFTSDEGYREKIENLKKSESELETAQKGLNDQLKLQAEIQNKTATETDQLAVSNKNLNQSLSTTAYEKQLEALNSLLEKKKEGVELSKVNAEIENGIFKDLEPQQKAELQRVADLVDKMRERQQLEKERQLAEGQKFSEQVMNDAKTDLEKIDADEKAKRDKLDYYNSLGSYSEQTYQNTLTSIKETAAKKRKKIQDDEKAAALKNTQDLLSASSSLFDGLAGIYKAYEGEQSESYKAMFAVSKGFQMANATLALYSAAMTAFDDKATTSPAGKVANYAAVIAAGGGLLAQIASISYGGGRLNGGGVAGNTMYRVGENNKPEIFQSGGKQYMIPGENGRVFSNNEVTGNSSQSLNWNFIVENNASGVEVSQPDVNREKMIVKWAVTEVANGVRNKQGEVWNALKSTTNVKSRL